ncbi:MAG: hypothetical protein ABII71_05145, partial [Candidatus Micrarchaeota archaeon]
MAPKSAKYAYKKDEGAGNPMIMLGILLALIIVGGVAIVLMLGQNGNEPPPGPGGNVTPPPMNITNETVEICGDECLLEKALTELDLSYCPDIENETLEEDCYEGLSFESLDACRHVGNDTLFRECIVHHAVGSGDVAVCEYLTDGILDCKGQVEDCYLVSDGARRMCLALKYDDAEYCGEDSECLYNFSMKSGNVEDCDAITDSVLKYACRSILLDQDDCYYAGTASQKDLCRLIWAKAANEKLTCTMISPETSYALECYSHFAIATHDPGFCRYNNILQINDLWNCLTNYSLATEDLAGCNSIEARAHTYLFLCYFEYAKKFGDPSACDLIGDPSHTNTCYVGSILDNPNLDYKYCADIVRVSWKNKCYTEY